jgi:hypothetical protein
MGDRTRPVTPQTRGMDSRDVEQTGKRHRSICTIAHISTWAKLMISSNHFSSLLCAPIHILRAKHRAYSTAQPDFSRYITTKDHHLLEPFKNDVPLLPAFSTQSPILLDNVPMHPYLSQSQHRCRSKPSHNSPCTNTYTLLPNYFPP